jgi:polyvinyl alcohol dehydrogenase (cytochrome)
MKSSLFWTAAFAFAAMGAGGVWAQSPPSGTTGAENINIRDGQFIFQKNCSMCHTQEGAATGGRTAPAIPVLQDMPPERIYDVLMHGEMQPMAAGLSDLQKRRVSEWLASRPMGNAEAGDIKAMTGRCAANPPLRDPAVGPSWNGWSPSRTNTRFQSAADAKLSAQQVPKLKLKWAFGVPSAAEMYSQPTVASGRVFFGSDSGFIYALDAKTGCAYWSFRADAGSRTAPIVRAITANSGTKYAVYFGDNQNRVYALDAQTGKLLWKTRVDAQPRSHMTASMTYADGRLFVPTSAGETLVGADATYDCCKSRGVVTAVDAASGKVLWRGESIQAPAAPTIKNDKGVQLWGPAGASIWNAPTVDEKRHLVYSGTGNAYTLPAADTSDSILAFDMTSGKLVWHHQQFQGDAFLDNCKKANAAGSNCPETLGPDWDFGGASPMLTKLPNGSDAIIAAGKGGVAIALDPDHQGKLLWQTQLYDGAPPPSGGLVVFGGTITGGNAYFPLNRPGGGIEAIRLSDGKRLWTTGPISKEPNLGQAAAASSIPGVIFTGAWDGVLRALSADDGKVLWDFDTRQDFKTVNGVAAKGGAFGAPGATVVDGMVFVGSGYRRGHTGNVLLAFAP